MNPCWFLSPLLDYSDRFIDELEYNFLNVFVKSAKSFVKLEKLMGHMGVLNESDFLKKVLVCPSFDDEWELATKVLRDLAESTGTLPAMRIWLHVV